VKAFGVFRLSKACYGLNQFKNEEKKYGLKKGGAFMIGKTV
jgi:hypothetical protein